MTLEAGKEMDRRCVLRWLIEVYINQSRAFYEYTDDELKMFAHDAIVLLKEQNDCENCAIAIEDRQPVVRCKNCLLRYTNKCVLHDQAFPINKGNDWFCADGERK